MNFASQIGSKLLITFKRPILGGEGRQFWATLVGVEAGALWLHFDEFDQHAFRRMQADGTAHPLLDPETGVAVWAVWTPLDGIAAAAALTSRSELARLVAERHEAPDSAAQDG